MWNIGLCFLQLHLCQCKSRDGLSWKGGFLSLCAVIIKGRILSTVFWPALGTHSQNVSTFFRHPNKQCAGFQGHLHSAMLWRCCFRIHRITERLRLKKTSGHHLVLTPAQAGSSRSSCPGLCPVGCWVSPKMETLDPIWATCASPWVTLPHSEKCVLWCSEGTFCVSICPYCLWSLGTRGKSGSILFASSPQVATTIDKIPPSD